MQLYRDNLATIFFSMRVGDRDLQLFNLFKMAFNLASQNSSVFPAIVSCVPKDLSNLSFLHHLTFTLVILFS